MKKYLAGLALAWVVTWAPMTAQAGVNWVPYKTGIVKAAIAKGDTALLFYKSTW